MIRDQVFLAFELQPRWLGEVTIRDVAMLSWVPYPLYQHILGRMVLLGQLIKSVPDDPNQPIRYLSSRLMTPVAIKEGRPV
jgi:hypothetical protein